MDYETFRRIIRGSVQYRMQGTVLTLTGYYTGEEVKIDLGKITPEMLEEIAAGEEMEEDYE